MRRYSFFLLILCLLAACGDDARIATVLNRTDSLMNSRPDSALSLLYNIESSVTGQSKSLCMRFQLLRHKAMNKVCVPFTSDSIMKEVTDYYNNHGTANEQVEANYLLGCVYRDLGETPHAIDCYRDAIAKADTTLVNCDYRTLSSVYSQLAWLFHKQLLFVNEADAHKQSGCYAQFAKDTLFVIYEMQMYAGAFISMNQKDSAEKVLTDVMRLYWDSGYKQEAIKASTMLMYVYSEQPEHLSDLKRLIDVYEAECDLFDENHELPPSKRQYYYYKGMYFQGIHQLDSAEYYFRKIHRKKMAFTSQAIMYKGLLGVFQKRRQSDSIAKYSQLYCMATDSSVAVKDQQQTAQLTASYRYNTIQRLALENEKTANRFRIILAISIIVFIVLVILISYFVYRYKNKQRELREEQIKKHLQEVNSLKLEFADATESYKENLHELQLLEESRKKVISIIRDELHGLNEEKDNYKKKYTELKLLKDRISEEYEKSIEVFRKENCELNEKIETLKQQDGISEHIKGSNQFVKNEIVKQIKDMTDNPLSTISPKQWENLIEVFSEFYPVLYKDILSCKLNVNCLKVCILTVIGIRNNEQANLVGLTKQNITNSKTSLNEHLFKEKTSRTLNKNLVEKYNIFTI